MARYLGLDLTASTARATAYAVLEDGCLAEHDLANDDDDIAGVVSRTKPEMVGIDAPLGLPRGLGCLEEPCACGHCQLGPAKLRACELELRRRLGVGCFFTTKRSIIKGMVYRGMALRVRLERVGCTVLEVYPYATRVVLWGKPPYRKQTVAGRTWTSQRLRGIVRGLPSQHLGHDQADAVLAAYTCYLYAQGQAELLGGPDEGQICVPARQGLMAPDSPCRPSP